jgi:hypothetical protein
MNPLYVLSGVVAAEAVVLLVFSYLATRLIAAVPKLQPIKTGAVLLFLVGIFWFVSRVRG